MYGRPAVAATLITFIIFEIMKGRYRESLHQQQMRDKKININPNVDEFCVAQKK